MYKTVRLNGYDVFSDGINNISTKGASPIVINTINAHSYIVAKKDEDFKRALTESDILLPDGEGIVLMAKKLKNERIKKIAGADIHGHLLRIAQKNKLRCFYLGSGPETLNKIEEKLKDSHNKIEFKFFSPPFKATFSKADNEQMIRAINQFRPDVLFVGMTAPKQEKWAYKHKGVIQASVICSIGAVFDFVAETKKRAPQWVIDLRLEWLYRSFTAWRLTKRYLYSTPLFLLELYRLKYLSKS